MNNVMDKIGKMKKEVLARCADRIAEAKKNPKKKENNGGRGITSSLKRDRGL
jgi:hypothetical protein